MTLVPLGFQHHVVNFKQDSFFSKLTGRIVDLSMEFLSVTSLPPLFVKIKKSSALHHSHALYNFQN